MSCAHTRNQHAPNPNEHLSGGHLARSVIALDGLPFDQRAARSERILLEPGDYVLGRAGDCEVSLDHEGVSRRHASISFREGRWFISDLSSRNGVSVNGIRVRDQSLVEIIDGDLLSIGPLTARVVSPHNTRLARGSTIEVVDDRCGQHKPRIIGEELEVPLAREQLETLFGAIEALSGVPNEAACQQALTSRLVGASGFHRVVVVRVEGDSDRVEAIAKAGDRAEAPLSRTLLFEAVRARQAVSMRVASSIAFTESMVASGAGEAICVPFGCQGEPSLYLYADRVGGREVEQGELAFVIAMARVGELALANIMRRTLEAHQERHLAEVASARAVQERILPAEKGVAGSVAYALRSIPGAGVAGDLADVVAIDAHRTAVFLGDVAGKGIAAGMLMATTQATVRALLERGVTPVDTLLATNAHLCRHTSLNEFVTLWLAIIDSRANEIEIVDAGHGFALRTDANGCVEYLRVQGMPPLGIVPDAHVSSTRLPLRPGDAFVVYSDGLTELRNAQGQPLTDEGVMDALHSAGPRARAFCLATQVLAHAETHAQGAPDGRDDLTILIFEVACEEADRTAPDRT